VRSGKPRTLKYAVALRRVEQRIVDALAEIIDGLIARAKEGDTRENGVASHFKKELNGVASHFKRQVHSWLLRQASGVSRICWSRSARTGGNRLSQLRSIS